MTVVSERAYAKVNLWLEVLGKRPDGYHELETVMHEVDLYDDVELEPGGEGIHLELDDPSIGVGEDNLALKAVRAVERRLGRRFDARIRIKKKIPAGGGLGGGSSDSGAVIRALNRAFELRLDHEEMESIAATFGSDTAFFVRGGTAMCRGRGEIVTPIPAGGPFFFVLVLPGIHCPTPRVFKSLRLTESCRQSYDLLRCLEKGDVAGMRARIFNRLEDPARREFSELDQILQLLSPHRAILSGSGSTIYLLCESRGDADEKRVLVESLVNTRTIVVSSASR